MENSNIYNDNTFDISSKEDLKDLNQIFLLANDGNTFKFRLGHDFFSYERNTDTILQYPDYKSLYEGVNNKLIYEKGINFDNDFGSIIKEGLDTLNLNLFKEFDLENKTEFLVNKEDKGISVKFSNKLYSNVQSSAKNLTDKLIPDSQELKPIKEVFDAFTKIGGLLFILNIKGEDKDIDAVENNKIIGLIIDELNNNNINADDLLNDKVFLDKVPGLQDVLNKYKFKYSKNFELNLELDNNGIIIENDNNILLLNESNNNLQKLLLESNIKPMLLLEYKKDIDGLSKLIPDNTETMSFFKSFVKNDDSLNYHNYTSYEIAAATMLAGIKTDLKRGDFDPKGKLFNELRLFSVSNDLNLVKISAFADQIIKKASSFVIVENDINNQNSTLKI